MEQRRLAAIMFTDMVGYSALVQENESAALALLEEHRHILRSIFPSFHGTEVKTIGDAFLVEFPSALDATLCAVEIQKKLRERNSAAQGKKAITIRIGLHVGDVIHKEKDVYGDGVNIAARIEPFAPPGGICCSEDVARQVQNKIEFPLSQLRKTDLKNIDLPVSLFRVDLPWSTKTPHTQAATDLFLSPRTIVFTILTAAIVAIVLFILPLLNRPQGYSRERIAVLPFENISADPNDEFFADGITEELISTLSKAGGISVIARTSVMKYKNISKSAAEIGQDLMVGTVLEGSVRRSAGNARIAIKLIDATSQKPIWSDEYDRDVKDIFRVQSEIAQRVTSELKIQLLAAEKARMESRGTENIDATRFYFLGRSFLNQRTQESVQKSVELFGEAIKADPDFALPYSGLAECYTLIGAAGYGFLPHQTAIDRATFNARKALELDESLAEAHLSLAYVHFRLEWAWEKAEVEFKKALTLKPGYAKAHELYGLYLALLGRHNEAIPEMQRALELDPRSPNVGTGLGRLFSFDRQYDRAIDQFTKTIKMDSTYAEAHFGLGLVCAYTGRFERAIEETRKAYELSGERLVILSDLGYIYAKAGRTREAEEVLKRLDELSKTIHVSPYNYAMVYVGLNNLDKAFEYLERSYQQREGLLIYMKADAISTQLESDPRYLALLKKIGFN